jgi:hypothetical protein
MDAETEAEAKDGEMAGSDSPVRRKARYHGALVEAFVAGAYVHEAAKKAGISERQAYRWLAENRDEVETAKGNLVDVALDELRRGLYGSARSLNELAAGAKGHDGEVTRVRASMAVVEAFSKLAAMTSLEQRLAALEASVAARPPSPARPWRPTIIAGPSTTP